MDVCDTPLFSARVHEIESNSIKARDKLQVMLTGYKRYKDALSALTVAQAAFASTLHDLYDGDEEGGIASAAGCDLRPFTSAMSDVTEYVKVLAAQMDDMSQRLQTSWMDGVFSALRESHRAYEKRQADMEEAEAKYLGMKKAARRDQVDKAWAELQVTYSLADDARADVARRMTEFESRRSHAFLLALADCLGAHVLVYTNVMEVMKRIQPGLLEMQSRIAMLYDQEADQARAVEIAIAGSACRRTASSGHPSDQAASSSGPGRPGGWGGMETNSGAPLQMSSAKHGFFQEIESRIMDTQASEGARVSILKQGTLYKRTTAVGGKLVDWKRRYFVLDSAGLLYYYSSKKDPTNKKDPANKSGGLLAKTPRTVTPKNTVALLTSTVKLDDEEGLMRFCFRLISPSGTFTLQAPSETDRSAWVDTIHAVITCLLNSVDADDHHPVGRSIHARNSRDGAREAAHGSVPSPIDGFATQYGGGTQGGSRGQSLSETPERGSQALPPIASSSSLPAHRRGPSLSVLPNVDPALLLLNSVAANAAGNPHYSGAGSTAGSVGTHHSRAGSGGAASGSSPGGGLLWGLPARLSTEPRGCGTHSPRGASDASAVLDRVRAVPGNRACADCGASDPDWASLNLAVTLCIECSGLHRQLGVHVSKVRSCTLDVKVWEPNVLDMFDAVGNELANEVWEARLAPQLGGPSSTANHHQPAAASSQQPIAGNGQHVRAVGGGSGGAATASAPGHRRHGAGAGGSSGSGRVDSWVWGHDDDDDELGGSARSSPQMGPSVASVGVITGAMAGVRPSGGRKPGVGTPLPEKLRFITEKWVERRFAVPMEPHAALALLWQGVLRGSARSVLQALAGGADPASPHTHEAAAALSAEAHNKAGGGNGVGSAGGGSDDAGPGIVHCAVAIGGLLSQQGTSSTPFAAVSGAAGGRELAVCPAAMLELVLQNGGLLEGRDRYGRTPLHYAIIFDNGPAAKVLLRRGASPKTPDAFGAKPFDVAVAKGRVTDEDLFLLLAGSSG
ncbi:hypothetical protein FOA52_002952 [Chlamydomonas sp. UWO 241]|nr:hypothetical protein FOA52_002952 [Chlamydomonas sp. UWO 241]